MNKKTTGILRASLAKSLLFTFSKPHSWGGVGVIGSYLTLLVTVTFYLRKRIGMRLFRLIHVLSLVGYLGVTLHGVYAGTDSPLPAMQLLYKGTGLVVIFLTVFWLVLLALRKLEARRLALVAAKMPHRRHATAR